MQEIIYKVNASFCFQWKDMLVFGPGACCVVLAGLQVSQDYADIQEAISLI